MFYVGADDPTVYAETVTNVVRTVSCVFASAEFIPPFLIQFNIYFINKMWYKLAEGI